VKLIGYIKRQEEHHRKTTFLEKYRKLLLDVGIQFDERYMLLGALSGPFGAVTLFVDSFP
jgi:hypothetical protein